MLLQANDYLLAARARRRASSRSAGPTSGATSLAGVDLIRRSTRAPRSTPSPGRSSPRRTARSSARRPGRGVWLDPDRTSPYQFFQYWMHTDDREVAAVPGPVHAAAVDEIDEVVAEHEEAPERRAAQRRWPGRSPTLVHGAEAAAAAEEAAAVLFGGPVEALDPGRRSTRSPREVPTAAVGAAELDGGLDVVEALHRAGLAASKERGPADGRPGRCLRRTASGPATGRRSDRATCCTAGLRPAAPGQARHHAALVVDEVDTAASPPVGLALRLGRPLVRPMPEDQSVPPPQAVASLQRVPALSGSPRRGEQGAP